jgi:CRP-like cAMP-binding protein/phosphoribosyl 1,2-cyclic phosphodiesterase
VSVEAPHAPSPPSGPVIRLSRGGVYVKTPKGPIQVGAPPETIKDSMSMGLPLPDAFVVPPDLFDRRRGLTLAEIEFPAYFNFFVLKRKAKLIVEREQTAARLRAVFRESLFGSGMPAKDDEFADSYPRELRPDFVRETDHFRRGPSGKCHDVDDLVDFCVMDVNGRYELPNGVSVQKTHDGAYEIAADGQLVARVPAVVEVPDRTPPSVGLVAGATFEPPSFGVSVLGASHGFDPNGKTTGFVLWVGHRGILIDPPVDTTQHLRDHGVMPKVIDGVILTHCHADHDSGVLAKLLEEGRVRLYTTPTILSSFLRKYSALSGLSQDVLRRTFSFCPVKIGAPTAVNGAELFFFYTLHSVPTIGFEAFYGGKSLAFSGDTLYEPEQIRRISDSGVITPERRDALIDFPWHHSVVLHEAGVPPLHTPTSSLAALPAHVKERLYLVHIAKKDIPEGAGLKAAEVGLEKTLAIDVREPAHAHAMDILNVFCSIDFFRDLPLSRARELLMLARRRRVAAGEKIITQDTEGHEFFVIASGSVSVEKSGQRIKTYHAGDFFGETAIILNQTRTADVIARTDVEMMTLDRHGFLYLLRGTDIPRRLVRLAKAREERSWELLEQNSALRQLSGPQKTQLQTYLELVTMKAGATLWKVGDGVDAAFLIDQGEVVLVGDEGSGDPSKSSPGMAAPGKPFGSGALLANVDGLRNGGRHASSAHVMSDARLFRIEGPDFNKFLGDNPGVLLFLMGTQFTE